MSYVCGQSGETAVKSQTIVQSSYNRVVSSAGLAHIGVGVDVGFMLLGIMYHS